MGQFQSVVSRQREFFETGKTKALSFRLNKLKQLYDAIRRFEPDIMASLRADLNKSAFEAYATEIGYVLSELRSTIKRLPRWAKPERVRSGLAQFGSRSRIYREPYGVVLVMAPWNYPFQLAAAPLLGAVAAGNCAIVKPSELTPSVSEVFSRLIAETFEPEHVTVVQGDALTSAELLEERFDHIFFTGSSRVGSLVMQAAARHLTPVTLELGGKSPCIVTPSARLDLAARRIVWGKFTNAGQTCIAPDYIYAHASVADALIRLLQEEIERQFGPDPLANPELTRIISRNHWQRLMSLIDPAKTVYGGRGDEERLRIAPTLLHPVSREDPVMREEIFGPILPILTYESLDEVIAAIRAGDKPLALYVFSERKREQRLIIEQLSFGGGCINDTVFHYAHPGLPFGGVGKSGMGAYHGRHTFETFSHRKGVLEQTTRFDVPVRYHRYKHAMAIIRKLLR
jgi:aldehyde dehydrogenase (NAD+)